ncbi:molybdopterin molybdotransferase MoeA [Methylobacterium aerolatum]|uniref:molybdopterin molybdotransferase MoeA n=1 Tax=Methylobacterium aerolatum TaxID=418708 RepID=UPI001EDF571F|nr:Molybdopterin molybdenumtransferase [Methylobacterium aerolatum]
MGPVIPDSSPPLSVADALATIRASLSVAVGRETVALWEADGRIVAEPVLAPMALPPFDNAAVDGYALRFDDLAPSGPTALPVAARIPAGSASAPLPPGTAARIFTGAPLPPGADTVAMQEETRIEGGTVVLPAGLARHANRRRAGEDVAPGALALSEGHRLGPRSLALAAALGLQSLTVRPRLRIALFSTGDEVCAEGGRLGPARIHDANRPMLAALLARTGARVSDGGILPDSRGALRDRLLGAAADHDLIVTSGGVSVGEEDHVRAVIGDIGALTLWRLAIKPGRPLAFGRIGRVPFVGLPGNPAAAYATALAILGPVVLHLTGAEPAPPLPLVRSGFAFAKKGGRREFLKVSLRVAADGVTEAVMAPGGALSALAASDGLVELPEDAEAIRPGDLLAYRPHAPV